MEKVYGATRQGIREVEQDREGRPDTYDKFYQRQTARQQARSAKRSAQSRAAWAAYYAGAAHTVTASLKARFVGAQSVRIGLDFSRNADGVTVARINRMGGLPDKGTAGTQPFGFPYSGQLA